MRDRAASRVLLVGLALTVRGCGDATLETGALNPQDNPAEAGVTVRVDARGPASGRPDATVGRGTDVAPVDAAQGRPDADVSRTDTSPGLTPDAAAARTDLGSAAGVDAAVGAPCETVVQYGSAWIHPDGHAADRDVIAGLITWDGTCLADGAGNAVATLSNGWQPVFQGPSSCRIALDARGDCGAPPRPCETRIAYGPGWEAAPNHPDSFDDVPGRLFPAGACRDVGGGLRAQDLSNAWVPHFRGDCTLSFRWTQCGGLYSNPVVPFDCPDPGVLRDGTGYVMACTSGNAPDAFPVFTSPDLVTWTPAGAILPAAARPRWAFGDFWAPEIHRIGAGYVAYFSARTAAGNLALGAATAPTATGPFTALDAPLLADPGMGLIDASAFIDAAGTPHLLWKEDGNAVGRETPIHVQALSPDGLGLHGPVATALSNDQRWEGALVEGPFVVMVAGRYYMFYSANAYYDARYALGVARSDHPMGPWEKRGPPILVSNGAFEGPGHGSVVRGPGDDGPGDDFVLIYHAWLGGRASSPPGRVVLVDALRWVDGWPTVPGAPSADSRPRP